MVKSKSAVAEQEEQLGQPNPADELLALRNRVAELEAEKKLAEEQATQADGTYVKELESLRKAKSQGLNEIKVKEIAPKTVSLWHVSGHNVGKRVGPIDANNAEETFLRFAFFKIRLSMTKPTEEWIAKYKQTEEYKISAKLEAERRARKAGTAKETAMDKLIKLQARQLGIDPKELSMEILPQDHVKGLRQ